jgi:hypothetical protein
MLNISIILRRILASFNESGYNCKMTEIPLKPGLEGHICESCLKGGHKSYGANHLPDKDKKGNWIDHEGNIIDPEDSELQRYGCKNEGDLKGRHVQCQCSPTWLESIDEWNKKNKTAFVKGLLKKVMDHLEIYRLPDPVEAARDLSGMPVRLLNEIYVSLTDDILTSITPEKKYAFDKKLLSKFLSVMDSASRRFHKDLKNLSKEDIKREIDFLKRASIKMATNPSQAEVWDQLVNQGLRRAIRDRDGRIFTGFPGEFHKKILNQIARIKPSEEEFLRNELLKDDRAKGQGSKSSPYIGFVNKKGEWMSREEVEEDLNKPKSYAQLFHYSSISDSIRRIAKGILDPDIKNPLPAIREEAESIYQAFIGSEEGKAVYERTKDDAFPNKVEKILNSLRPKISEASKDDPDKFQLLNAYLRDKISEGMRCS